MELNRLCGVRRGNETLMKSSFKGCEVEPLIFFFFFNIKGGDVIRPTEEKFPGYEPGSAVHTWARYETGFFLTMI